MLLIEPAATANTVLLSLAGDLRAPDGDRALIQAVQEFVRTGSRRIVLNLEKVTDVDAAGLGALVHARNLLDAVGGQVMLIKPNRRVADLLAIMKLNSVFDVRTESAADQATAASSPDRRPGDWNMFMASG